MTEKLMEIDTQQLQKPPEFRQRDGQNPILSTCLVRLAFCFAAAKRQSNKTNIHAYFRNSGRYTTFADDAPLVLNAN